MKLSTKFNEAKSEIPLICLSVILFAWNLFIGTPFNIVAANLNEYTYTTGGSILLKGIIYTLLLSLILMTAYLILLFIFKENTRKIIVNITIAVSISSWVNATLLVGRYGQLDGHNDLEIAPFGMLNWIQTSFFLVLLYLFIILRKKTKILRYIVSSVLSISFIASSLNIASKFIDSKNVQSVQGEAYFTYSQKNNNVMFFLLDEYQSNYFADLLDDRTKNKLNGVIWYRDAAANFTTQEWSLRST